MVIGNTNISVAGDATKLYVFGRAQFSNTATASGFKIPSGTSSQFLKADGSVDANTYLPASDTTGKWVTNIRRQAGSTTVEKQIGGSWTTAFTDSVGSTGGSVDTSLLVHRYDSSKTYGYITPTAYKGGFGGVDSATVAGDSVLIYGTSIEVGANCAGTGSRWTTLFVQGLTNPPVEVNRGIAGTTMSRTSPGDSSFIDRLYTVPNNRNTLRYIIIGTYAVNDCNLSKGLPAYRAALSAAIDTLTLHRNYPLSKIIICEPTIEGTNAGGFGKNNDTLKLYSDVTDSIALAKGVRLVRFWNWEMNNGGKMYVCSDSVHQNGDLGNKTLAKCILTTIGGAVNAGTLYVNNQVFFNQYNNTSQQNITGTLNWGNQNSTATRIRIFYTPGTYTSGIGYSAISGSTMMWSRGGLPLLFGNGGDTTAMTTSTAAFGVDANNHFFTTQIGARLPFGGLNGNQITGVSNLNGIGYNSSTGTYIMWGRQLTGGLMFGIGNDATAMTTSNASQYFNANGEIVFNKAIQVPYIAKATSYTTTTSDNTIEVTATGQTITLPTAASIAGRVYTIKLTASGSCTVATTSSQTIDGSTTYSLSAQYKYVTVMSNGSNWIITGNN